MQYLSYEVCSTMNGNFAQFDKKAKLFGRKIRIVTCFAVLCLYIVCNVIVSFLFNVRKSMSIETFRLLWKAYGGLLRRICLFICCCFIKVNSTTYLLLSLLFAASVFSSG